MSADCVPDAANAFSGVDINVDQDAALTLGVNESYSIQYELEQCN